MQEELQACYCTSIDIAVTFNVFQPMSINNVMFLIIMAMHHV